MTTTETGRPVGTEPGPVEPGPGEPAPAAAEAEARELARYTLFERLLHWVVAIAFVALLLSGLALAYPRLAWLAGLFGGGQTMRAVHPWFGLVFTAGMVLMLVIWGRGMWLDRTDRAWFRHLREYAGRGHVALLVTGVPLWFPSIAETGIRQLSRLTHHVAFLLIVAGFIIHVLLSAFLFPGTMTGMTSGRVSRAWAAWHHPRWYREQVAAAEPAGRTAVERPPDAKSSEP
jgi:formate dehydrogenase subunit gamma